MRKFMKTKKLKAKEIKRREVKRVKKNMVELKAISDFWFITINEADSTVIHHGKVEGGQSFITGQPSIEEYANELDYIERLTELGVQLPVLNNATIQPEEIKEEKVDDNNY
jgi:hypothetical protein